MTRSVPRFPARSIAMATSLLWAAGLSAQPLPIKCNQETCTFTLSFDLNVGYARIFSGAPFSGQESTAETDTFANGTHTSSTNVRPMVYRDSNGRLRIEKRAYQLAPGQPAPPDDFNVVEIQDAVAGYQYILDPVNHMAHRMGLASGPVKPWPAANTAALSCAAIRRAA